MIGNEAVSRLVGDPRVQREADGGSPQPAIRVSATFPSSLSVLGALESFGDTTVGGSAVTGSVSTGGTVDVGATAVISGPLTAGTIIAPVVVLAGGGRKKQDPDALASDRVDRAFSEGEEVPKADTSGTAPTPRARISEGEAPQGNGINAGEAPQPVRTEGDQPDSEESNSFSALSVLRSLTVGGNLVAGRARLGSTSTIGGSLRVSGGGSVGTLRAGGVVTIRGSVNGDAAIEAGIIQDSDAAPDGVG